MKTDFGFILVMSLILLGPLVVVMIIYLVAIIARGISKLRKRR